MAEFGFQSLTGREKEDVLMAVSHATGMTPFAVEKDWWVCCALRVVFGMQVAGHLVFKGGTSLSKAWQLTDRLSEDIDLSLDKGFFTGFEGDIPRSRIGKLRKASGAYLRGVFFEELKAGFREKGFTDLGFEMRDALNDDTDPRVVEVTYPNRTRSYTGYMKPSILIEIGCRSLREPYTLKSVRSFVDEIFTEREYAEPPFEVPTVDPERTALEKLFLLHEEFHRPSDRMRVERLSRHMYDLYRLSKAGIADRAILDEKLYKTIVSHRHKYSRVGGVDYNTHAPKTLDPIPNTDVIEVWRIDYERMRDEMIYGDDKPGFEDLIDCLRGLKNRIENMKWDFDLRFP